MRNRAGLAAKLVGQNTAVGGGIEKAAHEPEKPYELWRTAFDWKPEKY